LVTMMLSVIFLRDHVTRLRAFGFVLGFVGIIFTSIAGGEGVSSISVGDVYIFLSMFFQAISFILISVLNPTFDPRLLTGYMLLIYCYIRSWNGTKCATINPTILMEIRFNVFI